MRGVERALGLVRLGRAGTRIAHQVLEARRGLGTAGAPVRNLACEVRCANGYIRAARCSSKRARCEAARIWLGVYSQLAQASLAASGFWLGLAGGAALTGRCAVQPELTAVTSVVRSPLWAPLSVSWSSAAASDILLDNPSGFASAAVGVVTRLGISAAYACVGCTKPHTRGWGTTQRHNEHWL